MKYVVALILVIFCITGCNNKANQIEYEYLINVENVLSGYERILSASLTQGEAFPDLKERREELFNRMVIESSIGKEIRDNLEESLRISASICELIAMNFNTTYDIMEKIRKANVEIPISVEAELVYSSGAAPYMDNIEIKNRQLIELKKIRNRLFDEMKKQIE